MFYKIQKNEHEGANFFSTKMTEIENLGVFGLTLIRDFCRTPFFLCIIIFHTFARNFRQQLTCIGKNKR
jgi:hypothetical protein